MEIDSSTSRKLRSFLDDEQAPSNQSNPELSNSSTARTERNSFDESMQSQDAIGGLMDLSNAKFSENRENCFKDSNKRRMEQERKRLADFLKAGPREREKGNTEISRSRKSRRRNQINEPADRNAQDEPLDRPFVKLSGKWTGEMWKGSWFTSHSPNVRSTFEYKPDLSIEVDDDMVNQPCTICSGKDEDGFMFCDLCNRGFHAACCNITVFPAENEDWHCFDCKKVMAYYDGDTLPPSRVWKGWFDVLNGGSKERCVETFSMDLTYLKLGASLRSVAMPQKNCENTVPIIPFHGNGLNKFGNFQIEGFLQKVDGSFTMECEKAYVEPHSRTRQLSNGKNIGNGEIETVSLPLVGQISQTKTVVQAKNSDNDAQGRTSNKLSGKAKIGKNVESSSAENSPVQSSSLLKRNSRRGADTIAKGSVPNIGISNVKPSKKTSDKNLGAVETGNQSCSSDEETLKPEQTMTECRTPDDSKAESQIKLVMQLRSQISMLETKLFVARSTEKTLVITDIDCYFHVVDNSVPDNKIVSIWGNLVTLFSQRELVWISEVPRAPLDALLNAHSSGYLARLLESAYNSDDDHLCLTASGKVAGVVCNAVERTVPSRDITSNRSPLGSALSNSSSQPLARNALCVVRPSGHHVGFSGRLEVGDMSKGFCYFNSVAIGAIYAHQVFDERVAVVDISIEAGVGTCSILNRYASTLKGIRAQDLFYGSVDVDVPQPNLQLDEKLDLWSENSKIVVVENGITPNDWRAAFTLVLQALVKFRPSTMLISSGFDGLSKKGRSANRNGKGSNKAWGQLHPADYEWLTQELLQICPRSISVLEDSCDDMEVLLEAYSRHVGCFVVSN